MASKSKVCQLHSQRVIVLTHDVLRLQVSVHYILFMHIIKSLNHLQYDVSSIFLLKPLLSIHYFLRNISHVVNFVEQISSSYKLHCHVVKIFIFKELINSYNIRMVGLTKNLQFIKHHFLTCFVFNCTLVNFFNSAVNIQSFMFS